MVQAADPGDGPFDAHPKTGVRHGAVTTQVEIPIECLLGQVVGGDLLPQDVQIVFALSAPDEATQALIEESCVGGYSWFP